MLATLTAFIISMPLLAHVAYVWELVGSAWGATVLPVRVLGLAALVALLGAFLTGSLVPALWRRLVAVLAIVVLVGIALYQVGAMAGAHQAFKAEAEKALQAERKRAEKAEAITTIIATQAARDLAAERLSNRKLEDLNRALSNDPHRHRECVDRDTARRLRDL